VCSSTTDTLGIESREGSWNLGNKRVVAN